MLLAHTTGHVPGDLEATLESAMQLLDRWRREDQLMKLYTGTRLERGCIVEVDGEPLDPRLDLRNHSPDGFEWGYNGSGPSQLALALLVDCVDLWQALACYQEFKARVVCHLPARGWTLSEDQIRETCLAICEDQSRLD